MIGQIQMEEDSAVENLLIPGASHKFNVQISCQYLNFAQTEDIWLKSVLEGKMGVSLISGSNMVLVTP